MLGRGIFPGALCPGAYINSSGGHVTPRRKMVEILHMLFSPVQVLRSSSIGLLHVSNVS